MVSFKLYAGTNIGLRDNNEDNFCVCPDLAHSSWIVPEDCQQSVQLGELGCLMVVADGMGGQNAGEVASAIAIDTVRDCFTAERLSGGMIDKPSVIRNFMKSVIAEADKRVKDYGESHSEAQGMGSTIVMAWIVNQRVYVAWLGDSRAYSVLPNEGKVARLTKDHSYVQRLVDMGKLTEEMAMSHPNSNIITRSLGDITQKAKADVADFPIEDNEVILLCTDGLCGVCADSYIRKIVEESFGNLQTCKERLTEAALDAGGSDNITMAMVHLNVDGTQVDAADSGAAKRSSRLKYQLIALFLAVVVSLSAVFLIFSSPSNTVVEKKTDVKKEVKASTPQKISKVKAQEKEETIEKEVIKKMVDNKNKTEKEEETESKNGKTGNSVDFGSKAGLTESDANPPGRLTEAKK